MGRRIATNGAAGNQLVGDGIYNYRYDKIGNLVEKAGNGGQVSYTYNALNLLEKWTDGNNTETYSYNAAGLISQVTTDTSTTALTWDILYGDGVVISADENGAITDYTYGLERISASSKNSRTEYVYDGRGSVIGEVTKSGLLSKAEILTKSYTPFGEQIGEKTSGFGWNGEYYNAETGQVYLRARFYEPEMNRFSQKDILRGSITNGASLNRYLYCQNDPVNFMDSSGESLKSVASKVTSAVKTAASAVKSAATKVVNTVTTAVNKLTTPKNTAVNSANTAAKKIASTTTAKAAATNPNSKSSVQQSYSTAQSSSSGGTSKSGGFISNLFGGKNRYCTDDKKTDKAVKENAINKVIDFISGKDQNVAALGVSGSVGLGLDLTFSSMLVMDRSGNMGTVITLGAGGGLGASIGAGGYINPNAELIGDLPGTGVDIGGTVAIITVDADDSGGLGVSFGKVGLEFHSLITRTFVIDIF